MNQTECDEFTRSLHETILWCTLAEAQEVVSFGLRTPALEPFWNWDRGYGMMRNEGPAVVDETVRRRRASLLRRGMPSAGWAAGPAEGRLLHYQPDLCLDEGLAQDASGGFFDMKDAPPWDTWVWCVPSGPDDRRAKVITLAYVLAWIPAKYYQLAQYGINAQPTDAIGWADLADAPFLDELRARGLL